MVPNCDRSSAYRTSTSSAHLWYAHCIFDFLNHARTALQLANGNVHVYQYQVNPNTNCLQLTINDMSSLSSKPKNRMNRSSTPQFLGRRPFHLPRLLVDHLHAILTIPRSRDGLSCCYSCWPLLATILGLLCMQLQHRSNSQEE